MQDDTDTIWYCFVIPKPNKRSFIEVMSKKESDIQDYMRLHVPTISTMHTNKDYLVIGAPKKILTQAIWHYKAWYLSRWQN